MTEVATKRLFDVREYYGMLEAGILAPEEKVELINGEIIQISPIGSQHAACVSRLRELIGEILGKSVIIRTQDPVRLNDKSEPEPDLAILRRQADFYASAHPQPEDVLLLIEVADSSLHFDQHVKLPLYAAANIPEVWIIDITNQKVQTFSAPEAGAYKQQALFRVSENVTSTTLPDLKLSVDNILPD